MALRAPINPITTRAIVNKASAAVTQKSAHVAFAFCSAALAAITAA
jgi:hypothetical protein